MFKVTKKIFRYFKHKSFYSIFINWWIFGLLPFSKQEKKTFKIVNRLIKTVEGNIKFYNTKTIIITDNSIIIRKLNCSNLIEISLKPCYLRKNDSIVYLSNKKIKPIYDKLYDKYKVNLN